jgi:dTDP-glucose 4,6-dehydratase/UDP-glucose 4-epimerase
MKQLLRETDFVFNLAGQTSHLDSMTDPLTDLAINTAAQISLLESCREVAPECKIVFASTRQIYGRPQYLPVDEAHPINPVDANGINKWAGESYHRLYADVYGLNTTVLRLTNTYGPGMRVKDARQTFLGIWIRQALEGQPFLVFGDGEQLRDFNYVDDVVDALLRTGFQEKAMGKIYNLGGEEVVSLNELAKLLTEIVPESTFALQPFPKDRASIDIGDYFGSISQIKADLNWEPKIPLVEGLRKTVDYYREHGEHYWGTDS